MAEIARSELILGGQKSGKSRRAEMLAQHWLASPGHDAVLIATGQALDDEMRERIERHRRDRAVRVPRLHTVEEPFALASTVAALSAPTTLIIIDCLTLWLTNQLMPLQALPLTAEAVRAERERLCKLLDEPPGPVVVVGNEIGLGVIPLGPQSREFVDALGLLNQAVAAACERVSLMVAGCVLTLKERR